MPKHETAFEATKRALSQTPTLAHFDRSKPVTLQTDASRLNGLGFTLMQQDGDTMKLIQCGSRFISQTESRYSTTEIEMLAVIWAMKKCHVYLMGMNSFKLVTDHRALVSLLDKHRLDELPNPRIQRMREKIMGYKFNTEWIKGKSNTIPDVLSRFPVDQLDDENENDEEFLKAKMEKIN